MWCRRIAVGLSVTVLLAGCGGGGGTGEDGAATGAGQEETSGGAAGDATGGEAAGGETAGGDAAGDGDVAIVDNAFEPADLDVAAGTAVTWENTGSRTHTVTFEDGEDSGDLAAGDTYERSFDAAGAFPYACRIHPSMQGTVTVG
ncbi:cupredoxin domain-containing protein [Egicoccus sp. AB-alg2]|uniref:cupredoxin domain-containing protein n=1 Tax=Egicoccus sp. AB-alg2 TaxID=3242693 RepID=UPI00359D3CA5